MPWWANEEQNAYMRELDALPDEKRCWCGWYPFGECPNSHCRPGKTRADKLAAQETD